MEKDEVTENHNAAIVIVPPPKRFARAHATHPSHPARPHCQLDATITPWPAPCVYARQSTLLEPHLLGVNSCTAVHRLPYLRSRSRYDNVGARMSYVGLWIEELGATGRGTPFRRHRGLHFFGDAF